MDAKEDILRAEDLVCIECGSNAFEFDLVDFNERTIYYECECGQHQSLGHDHPEVYMLWLTETDLKCIDLGGPGADRFVYRQNILKQINAQRGSE